MSLATALIPAYTHTHIFCALSIRCNRIGTLELSARSVPAANHERGANVARIRGLYEQSQRQTAIHLAIGQLTRQPQFGQLGRGGRPAATSTPIRTGPTTNPSACSSNIQQRSFFAAIVPWIDAAAWFYTAITSHVPRIW